MPLIENSSMEKAGAHDDKEAPRAERIRTRDAKTRTKRYGAEIWHPRQTDVQSSRSPQPSGCGKSPTILWKALNELFPKPPL